MLRVLTITLLFRICFTQSPYYRGPTGQGAPATGTGTGTGTDTVGQQSPYYRPPGGGSTTTGGTAGSGGLPTTRPATAQVILRSTASWADGTGATASTINGVLTFTQSAQDGAVTISGTITDTDGTSLTAGDHGFHVDQLGALSGGCTDSASHFNPASADHGAPADTNRHVGDLGNVAAASSSVTVAITDSSISLTGANSIIGRAIVLHADPDDFTTQTTGNAGGRLACGIVAIASETAITAPAAAQIPAAGGIPPSGGQPPASGGQLPPPNGAPPP